ncbi:MAG TPA: SMC-Scp complex subunit ScpB [Lacipirellulaceae bacterium]|nr:SMC-Scp complex subunit ScpB [Lacipirellulaceae bacterium]
MLNRTGQLAVDLGSPARAVAAPWAAAARRRRELVGWAPPPPIEAAPAAPAAEEPLAARRARVEAALFLAREPLSTRKLAELAGVSDGTEARALVRDLAARLLRRGSAFLPVGVAQGIQLMTRPQLADWIGKLLGDGEEVRLSAPALETLAVVAYRQPITRAEVEGIRGVQCGELLRVLMERDLLRIVGRSDDLGRPFLYGTTRKFLQVFGLGRLEQLPPVDQICNAVAPRPAAA